MLVPWSTCNGIAVCRTGQLIDGNACADNSIGTCVIQTKAVGQRNMPRLHSRIYFHDSLSRSRGSNDSRQCTIDKAQFGGIPRVNTQGTIAIFAAPVTLIGLIVGKTMADEILTLKEVAEWYCQINFSRP